MIFGVPTNVPKGSPQNVILWGYICGVYKDNIHSMRKKPIYHPSHPSGGCCQQNVSKQHLDGYSEQAVSEKEYPLGDYSQQIVSEQEQAAITESVQSELEKQNKKASKVSKLSAVWTIISTVYAIASTCIFIAKDWVSNALSIVLICILAVFVCVFIVLLVLTFRDVKGGVKRVKMYKKTLKIFKALANVVLLSVTAVSMVGISVTGFSGAAKLIAFIITFIVAVVQLALKITTLIMNLIKIRLAKKFKVEIVKFVDGKKAKKGALDKVKEKSYKKK